jgi:hypothetical protein
MKDTNCSEILETYYKPKYEFKIQREKQNQKCLECNLDLDSNCPECNESNESNNGQVCELFAQGTCDCVFHFHCISTHLKTTNQNCPIHKTEWWYKRYWKSTING